MTLAASAQLSIFDENNTPQDKGQVGVTILSQKTTRAHRLFVYDSNKQGLATGEINADLRAVVQSEVYLTFYDSNERSPLHPGPFACNQLGTVLHSLTLAVTGRYCTLKFGSKAQAVQFESKIAELLEEAAVRGEVAKG